MRGVDYETFEKRTPHGVPGAKGHSLPSIPGPTYFNESVIPDASETETSEDGGMIWTSVPAGTYRIVARHPDTRFASFLATCEPGRVVNANPPWGTYELRKKERPLGASVVAGGVSQVRAKRTKGGRGSVRFTVDAGERLDVRTRLQVSGKRGPVRNFTVKRAGSKVFRLPAGPSLWSGRAKLRTTLTDAARDQVVSVDRVAIPADD